MSDKFKEKKITELSFGDFLKFQRKEKGFSLDDLSLKTGISKANLKNLEEENWDKLPSEVYINGFIQRYASVLGIDKEKIFSLFKESRVAKNKNYKNKKSLSFNLDNFFITPKKIKIILFFLLVIFLIAYFAFQVYFLLKPPELVVLSPKDGIIVNEKSLVVVGYTDSGSSVYVNDNEIPVKVDGSFSVSIPLKDGLNQIIIKTKNKFGKERVVKKVVLMQK